MTTKEAAIVERGEYVIGIAVILAALLVSTTIYISVSGLQDAVGKLKLNVAPAQPPAAAPPAASPPAQAAPAAPAAVDDSFSKTDPSIGPKDAKVTVIAFADYQCPYCGIVNGRDMGARFDSIKGSATKITNEYAKTGKIRFAFHAMAFLGQESTDAANAAFCARDIGGGDEAYFKMHDILFAKQQGENDGTYAKAKLKAYAAEAGFNKTLDACIDSGKFNDLVAQSTATANAAGIQGTPGFMVNGKQVSPEYTALKAAIDAAIAG